MKTESNDLRHKITCKDADGNDMIIKIRLNDECHNGHQDFSITANGFTAGKPRTDSNFLYGGCCHDEILAVRPDLKLFVNLHLCDYLGNPMAPASNGLYFMRQGFNTVKPEHENFMAYYCDHMRITEDQFKALQTAEDKLRFASLLESLGIPTQWKAEANEAIKLLEEWTDTKFIIDSRRTQYEPLTDEQTAMIIEREATGYYLPQNIAAREDKRIADLIAKQYADLANERDKTINKAHREHDVKKAVLDGGLPLDNFILYTHTNEGTFNWYENAPKITLNQFQEFTNSDHAKVDGITWKLGSKGK